jgi:PPIC-type PPIASE domain
MSAIISKTREPRAPTSVRRLRLLAGLACAVCVPAACLVGCGGSEHNAGTGQASTASSAATTATKTGSSTAKGGSGGSPPGAVATVAGAPVAYGEYASEYGIATQAGQAVKDPQRQAMRIVLYRNWLKQAAAQAGVSVSEGEAKKSAEEQLARLAESSNPAERAGEGASATGAAAQQQYLQAHGLTLADLQTEARTQLLRAKLSASAAQAATATLVAKLPTRISTIPSSQLEAYYNTHKQKLAQPNTRNIEIVRFHTASEAGKGLAELQRGESFGRVGRLDPELNRSDNYAERENVTPPGYMLPNGISTGEDPTIAKAAFGASTGTIVGPVKGSPPYVAYFILRVVSEALGAPKPLSAVRSEVASLVASQNQQAISAATHNATERFEKEFIATWRAKTVCAAGYVMEYCANDRSGGH